MAFGDIKGTKTGTATSITASFACATGTNFAVIAGDLIVALCAEQTTVTTTACTDNLGNTYTPLGAGLDAGTVTGRGFYSRVTNAGTISSVTFTATASNDNVVGLAVGFEGPFETSPVDAAPAGIVNDNTTPYTCPPTGTLAQADEKIVCAIIHNGNPTFTATSPNAIAVQLNTATILKAAIGHQTVSSTASVTPAFTSSATPTASAYDTVSFKKELPPTAEAWNKADKGASIALSNSDKTATSTSTTAGAVRSTTSHLIGAAGKYYAEFLLDTYVGGQRFGIQGAAPNNILSVTNSAYISSQSMWVAGSAVASFPTSVVTGDVIGVALDTGAQRIWFRRNSGTWNNDAAANPATGANGLDASAIADAESCLWMSNNGISGSVITLRTEVADFTLPHPSGFASWMGEAPQGEAVGDADGIGAATAVGEATNAAAGVISDTFNPNDKYASIVLSNNNLSVSTSLTEQYATVRSCLSRNSGKYYFEMRKDSSLAGETIFFGLATSSFPLFQFLGIIEGSISVTDVGYAYPESLDTGKTFTDGEWVGLAVDFDAGKFWVRNASGFYGDPVAGTGQAVDFFANTEFFAAITVFDPADSATANFGATAFAYAPPSGFSRWSDRAGGTATATGATVAASAGETATGIGAASAVGDSVSVTIVASDGTAAGVGAASATGAAIRLDAWNAADKSANITLSNNDKTATLSAAVTSGVRSTTKYLNGTETGKFYVEFLLNNVVGTVSNQVGIREVSASLTSTAGSTAQCASNSGNILTSNATIIGNVGGSPLVDGDIICMAWVPATERIWFRKNNGLWNNDAAANPATNTNGLDVSVLNNTDHALFFLEASTGNGAITTVRTELADLTYSGPSGFTSWMGEAIETISADGSATSIGAASATGAATNAAQGETATGIGVANAVGAATNAAQGQTATGVGAASATGAQIAAAQGQTAAGLGGATASGAAIGAAAGQTATGIGTASATGNQIAAASGASSGIGAATAGAIVTAAASGLAQGTGIALGDVPTAEALIEFETSGTSSASANSYTIPLTVASAIGKERLVAVAFICSGNWVLNSVTVDGQAATSLVQVRGNDDGGGGFAHLGFFRAPGTSATNINVVVTGSVGTAYSAYTACWTLTSADTLLDTATATTDDPALNLDTSTGGLVAAAALAFSVSPTPSAAWTGTTENVDGVNVYGSENFTASSANVSAGETPRTLNLNWEGSWVGGAGDSFAACSVSFNPAAASAGTIVEAAGSAAGTSTAAAVGSAVMPASGTAAGTAVATATSQATKAAAGSASATSLATAIGWTITPTAGTAAATSAATAVSAATKTAAGTSAAIGAATAAGAGTVAAAGSAAGVGTCGSLSDSGATVGAATGLGTASAIANVIAATTGTAAGVGAITAISDSARATGTAAGVGGASATAIVTAATKGTADGIGDAHALTDSGATVGAADGVGVASAIATVTATTTATAAGVGGATSVGAKTVAASGTAAGVGIGSGVGIQTAAASGTTAGVGYAIALGDAGAGIGAASGIGAATANGAKVAAAIGATSGAGAASATASPRVDVGGIASGAGTASATVTVIAVVSGTAAGVGTGSSVGGQTIAVTGTAAGIGGAIAPSDSGSTIGTASGIGVASATTRAFVAGIGTGAGVGAVSSVGAKIAGAVGTAAATGAASANSQFQQTRSGNGTAIGIGGATATGAKVAEAIGTAGGLGLVTTIGQSIVVVCGTAIGTTAATAIGTGLIPAVGNAAGVGTQTAPSLTLGVAHGAAAGVGATDAHSEATASVVGIAAGIGAGVSLGSTDNQADAVARGSGTALASGLSVIPSPIHDKRVAYVEAQSRVAMVPKQDRVATVMRTAA